MKPQLRLRPTQRMLSPIQEAEARRFAAERIAAQLSTELVDEPEAEQLLRDAYTVAGCPPPKRIRWVDGPLQLTEALALCNAVDSVWWSLQDGMKHKVDRSMEQSVAPGLRQSVWTIVGRSVSASVWTRVYDSVRRSLDESLDESAYARVYASARGCVPTSMRKSLRANVRKSLEVSAWEGARAYQAASALAYSRFFDEYLAPNDLHALAHFNERVSGYWLGKREAILVRRPRLLSRDAEGRLHSTIGKCIEYRDGWGFYAWHGVRVPEQAILRPEQLTRADFLNEQNVEVRRIIQERMGERFVSEMYGRVIDRGPRGTLYEVCLPADDLERVARYVQVQDASTGRRYFLRVPPTIQTAAEAVAWTFQAAVEDYRPAQET